MAPNTLIGKQAPALSLPDSKGDTFTLETGKGVPIALFFYPKSGTYGCTKEACQFRDAIAEKDTFKPGNAVIVGISADPVEKQKAFVEQQKLTYPILSDSKGEARKAYGVGKGLLGLTDARVTFIIDGKGVVRDSIDTTLNFGAHSKFVTKWLDKLAAEEKAAAAKPEGDAPAKPQAITAAPAEPQAITAAPAEPQAITAAPAEPQAITAAPAEPQAITAAPADAAEAPKS